MAEAEYAEKVRGSRPILLLDDVFSELDEDRRMHLFSFIEQQQTIITWQQTFLKKEERCRFSSLETLRDSIRIPFSEFFILSTCVFVQWRNIKDF